MRLGELLGELCSHPQGKQTVGHFVSVSSEVKAGDVFCALPGANVHGAQFAEDAISQGALCVLADKIPEELQHELLIEIDDLSEKLPSILNKRYGFDRRIPSIFAVTGTNGKTSCCHFLATGLHAIGEASGTIGTLGWGLLGQAYEKTAHTTPDLVSNYRLVSELMHQGARHVAMEVSSHALSQGRVRGLPLEIGILTNVTRDHLDYHGSWEAYAEVKASLFASKGMRFAICNDDDPYVNQLRQRLNIPSLSYSLHNVKADVSITHCELSPHGTVATVQTPSGVFPITTQLVGEFNLSNTLACIAAWIAKGFSITQVQIMCDALTPVPGRLQRVGGSKNRAAVYVDYAHTPDALEKVLQSLRLLTKGRLICVFGCGGDRDQGKRSIMGAIASNLADRVIVTSDNPRSEDPSMIADGIVAGLDAATSYEIILDRKAAITRGIALAEEHEIVLIAGTGHETEQILIDKVEYFCDVSVAESILKVLE